MCNVYEIIYSSILVVFSHVVLVAKILVQDLAYSQRDNHEQARSGGLAKGVHYWRQIFFVHLPKGCCAPP